MEFSPDEVKTDSKLEDIIRNLIKIGLAGTRVCVCVCVCVCVFLALRFSIPSPIGVWLCRYSFVVRSSACEVYGTPRE